MDRRFFAIVGLFATLASVRVAEVWGQAPSPSARPVRPVVKQVPAEPPGLPEPEDPGPPPDPTGRPLPASVPDEPLPPRDEDLLRVGAEGVPNLPQAPGTAPSDPLVLAPENLSIGPQSVALTVEVESPQVANLNKETTFSVRVKNIGKTDARGVLVRDVLPDGLEYVDGLAPQPVRNGPMLTWTLDSLAAGTERVLKFRARPTRVGPLDHAATVSLRTGAKARTIVQQPKLKVELVPSTTKVLKGQQVQFKATVSNPGTGPARNVVVQAKLTNGLRHEQNSRSLDLTLPGIKPNESIPLEALVLDAVAGGIQSCEVVVRSPDVVPSAEDLASLSARCEVEVIEPLLNLTIEGNTRAYTGQAGNYRLIVENPGTAAATNVAVAVYIPEGGELTGKPSEGRYDALTRNLRMTIPRLEPKEKLEFPFRVKLGGVQIYKISAKAQTADRSLTANQMFTTEVTGLADIRISVTERVGILDVGETVDFEIRVRNVGSKEARDLLVWAKPSENIQVISTDHDGDEDAQVEKTTGNVKFPPISRLAPGGEQRMIIKVKTTAPGKAICRAYVLHDEEKVAIEAVASARVEAFSSTPRR